jgi:hypothetical protein
MKFDAMKAVYCYYFPQVRPLLHEVERSIPDELYFVTAPVEEIEQKLAPLFDPPLQLPALNGCLDLDEFHVPIIQRIVAAYDTTVPALSEFDYSYPTSGSSEGLFHILAQLKADGVDAINVLDGEYEGYAAQARNLGLEVHVRLPGKSYVPGIWFISNPSARNGNLLPEGFVNSLCQYGNRVVLDLAYAGSTVPHIYDVSHPNLIAVVLSFSKPYGVFRSRIGGFTFSRTPFPTLFGNKWFKDTLRLCQALKLAECVGPNGLYPTYHPVQKRIIRRLNKELGLGIRASDALLIGHLPASAMSILSDEQRELVEPYRRGPGFRFCLTPYFEREERGAFC